MKTPEHAKSYLASTTPDILLVTDAGLLNTHSDSMLSKKEKDEMKDVLKIVEDYVRHRNGFVMFGCLFSSFARPNMMDYLFGELFGLGWRSGGYSREIFKLNTRCEFPQRALRSAMPGPFSMKALRVRGAGVGERLFGPEGVDEMEAGVAGAAVGNGYVVFCGDVNSEESSNQIVLALCGLTM